MQQEDALFYRLAPFIQDYIYQQNWTELRAIQNAAAQVLFETQDDLLLTSSTASGKTEAAFFPILSMLWEDTPQSVGCLYIAPLKSLINDQFYRLQPLLEMADIPLTHWHGDVGASEKERLLRVPRGILQITPESLESLLLRRPNDAVRLFAQLQFVVIDEIHVLMGSDRGDQILCQLTRLARLIGHIPRRVGLSATIGETQTAAAWLGAGTQRRVQVPIVTETNRRWRLAMEHFFLEEQDTSVQKGEKAQPDAADPGFLYLYACVQNRKALVFSNSREETEYVTATLRQIARLRGEPDRFLIHHGNLSASLREQAEAKMKKEEENVVTCATVTLELGVDIGRLERVVQLEAPHSVSAFLQRLGRSGRRGAPPEMVQIYREENPTPDTPLPKLLPWNLLRGIAIVQLYLESQFIEPPRARTQPMSLLFHQTLSVLAAAGELTPKELAARVLTLPPFAQIAKEDYKTLLLSMAEQEYLEMTEERGLIIGLRGERLINHFKFFAVFRDQNGKEFVPTGGTLGKIAEIDISKLKKTVGKTKFIACCDVTNPLIGENGASRIYAPQKGADSAAVDALEKNMEHYAAIVGDDIAVCAGSGAAGGLGAAVRFYFGGELAPGFATLAPLIGLEEKICNADIVLTGEGCTDNQTNNGKLPAGVAGLCRKHGKRCIVISGAVKGEPHIDGAERILPTTHESSMPTKEIAVMRLYKTVKQLLEETKNDIYRK